LFARLGKLRKRQVENSHALPLARRWTGAAIIQKNGASLDIEEFLAGTLYVSATEQPMMKIRENDLHGTKETIDGGDSIEVTRSLLVDSGVEVKNWTCEQLKQACPNFSYMQKFTNAKKVTLTAPNSNNCR